MNTNETPWYKNVLAVVGGITLCGITLGAVGWTGKRILDVTEKQAIAVGKAEMQPQLDEANRQIEATKLAGMAAVALIQKMDGMPIPKDINEVTVCVDTTTRDISESSVRYGSHSCGALLPITFPITYAANGTRTIGDPKLVRIPKIASR